MILTPSTNEPWWASYFVTIINTIIGPAVLMWWTKKMRNEGHEEHLQTVSKVAEVKAEVKTANALKLGELADAAETRRVDDIPVAERTEAEQIHIDLIPMKH